MSDTDELKKCLLGVIQHINKAIDCMDNCTEIDFEQSNEMGDIADRLSEISDEVRELI